MRINSLALRLLGLGLALAAPSARADQFTASWLGGTIWEQDGAWSTTAYPNNGHIVTINGNPVPGPNPTYNVDIRNPAPCTLGIGVAIQSLNVASGATLNVQNSSSVTSAGPIVISGTTTLNSNTGGSQLRAGPGSGVSASGIVLMSDTGTNYISGSGDGFTFTINAGGVVRGAGQMNLGYFGGNEHLLNFVNHGLIEATQPNNLLQIGLGGQEGVNSNLTNDGVLQASGSGALRVHAFNTQGTVFNTGGKIRAIDNAQVRIESPVVVTGGTLETAGSGFIHGDGPGAGGGVLKDLTNTGRIEIGDSEELTLAGTFTNTGAVRLTSTGGGSILRFSEGTTLLGPGAVTLSNNASNYIMSANDGDAFTIGANAIIEGAGSISPGFSGGSRMARITNLGLIDVNVAAASLTIRAESSNGTDFRNIGTLRASNGGTLALSGGGRYSNDSGTIAALAGSIVQIAPPALVSGGTVTSSGTGFIRGAGPGAGGGTLSDVTNTGHVAIGNGEELTLAGTFTNNGSVTLASTGSGAILRLADGTTLGGAGAVTLSNNGTNYIMGVNGGEHVTIAPGATIHGAGNISPGFSGGSNMIKITNQGLIDADISGSALTIRTEQFTNTALTNAGTLRASNGATLSFTGTSTLTNNGGTLTASAGSTISDAGGNTLLQTDGAIDLDGGTISFPLGVDLNGGQLIGTGTFNGPIRNNGGIVGPGHSPGQITINGNYTQGSSGVLNIEIGGNTAGTGYDQLVVHRTATLGGTLNISLINGYRPAVGDVFTILAPNSVTGEFDHINASGVDVQANYASGAITVTVTSVPNLLLNISTRLRVLAGDNALIGGFIVTGTEPKKVIIRAIGPSLLDQGVSGALTDPMLELFDDNGSVATNDDWKQDQQSEIEASGVAPTKDAEAAIVRTLPPGNYTAVVRGKNNGVGIGLVEAYDLSQSAKSKLANISSRGFVDTGDNALIGGFIAGGLGGGTSTKVVVRAIGPSLADQQVSGALVDPTLQLIDANGSTVRANDNWKETQQAELEQIGIQPSKDAESALIATLPAGSYTAVVRGKGDSTGIGLVEVYNIE